MTSEEFIQELRDIAQEVQYELREKICPGKQFEEAMERIVGTTDG
jgi:hypothetical protein